MKPNPGDMIGCVECKAVFELPRPELDVIYIPTCPTCDTVVGGYEDTADRAKRNSEAITACQKIEQDLNEIIERSPMYQGINDFEGGIWELNKLVSDLNSINQFASQKQDELTDDS